MWGGMLDLFDFFSGATPFFRVNSIGFLVTLSGKKRLSNPNIFSLGIFLLLSFFFISPSFAADVQLSQFTDSPDPAVRGGTFVYTLNVENNAGDTATNVVLSLPLPATTTYVSLTGTGCSHNGAVPGTVTCNFGDLLGTLAGGPVRSVTVTIRSTAATGATVNTTGTVSSTSADTNPANNALSQTTTIDDGADLMVTKSPSPASVAASGIVDWTIGSQNLGPNDATGITLTDTLPGTLTYVSASGAGWSCSAAGQVVTCTRASVASGVVLPDVTIRTRVTGAVTGIITNPVTIGATSPTDPITSNNTSTANVTVTTGTDLAVTKSVSPNPAISGQDATFTLQPRNNGPFDAANATVIDTLPAGFSFVSAVGAGWSCSAVGQTVTCDRATYSVGATDDITLVATTPVVAALTGYTNNAVISSDTPDPIPANDTTNLNFNIVPDGRDLSIAKTKSPNPVAQNSQITSRITVTNNGPQNAAAGTVQITDTLDLASETYGYGGNFYAGAGWTCSLTGNVVTCEYANALNNGASASVDIYTTAIAIGAISNTACAVYTGAAPGDPVAANDCQTRSVTSTNATISPDLAITKSATTLNGDKTLSDNEETITYTVTVTNNGPGDASGMIMTDTIPGHVAGLPQATGIVVGVSTLSTATFACTTGATVTCTQSGGVLAPTETVAFTIHVSRPLTSGSLTNTARITSTTLGDPDPSNNVATDTVTVDANADVEVVSKSVSPATVYAGTEATYVISVRNNGPSTASNVHLVDALCDGTSSDCDYTFVSATATGGGACVHDGLGHEVTCDWASLNSGQSQSVTVVIMPNWQAAPPAGRHFDNTAVISTTTTEKWDSTDWDNNYKTAVLNINPATLDLVVNKTDTSPAGPDPLGYTPTPVGDDNLISYRIAMTNRGPSLATGVTFDDTITPPVGKRITFVRVSDTPFGAASITTTCTNTGTTSVAGTALSTSCTLGENISSGATENRYLIFEVEDNPASGGDTFSDSVTLSCNEDDTNPANDTEGETTTVRSRADIAIAKVPSLGTVQLRQPFYWTITVTNHGPGNSQQTTLSDTLPTGMQYITPTAASFMPAPYNAAPYSSGAAWTNNSTVPTNGLCSVSGSVISCNFGLVEAGSAATLTVPVRMTSYPTAAPAGTTTNCATATTSEVDPISGNNVTICNVPAVNVQRSSLAGVVYRDNNNDGAQLGALETGITGVVVTLTGTDAYGNAVNTSATTPAAGTFSFADLSPADGTGYTLTETHPVAFFDGKETAGSVNGTVDNTGFSSAAAYNRITAILLPGNTAATSYLFGELPGNTVSGVVYADTDNDGVRDGGEIGINAVTLTLTGTDFGPDGVLGGGDDLAMNTTTTTDAAGAYTFTGLRAGDYTVTETQPAGYLDGLDTAGTVGGAACATCSTATNDAIAQIVMSTFGIAAADMNFGELAPSSLAGNVYNDADNNGSFNIPGGDAGLVNITVTLTGTNDLGAVNGTTTTAADGSYSFINLRPGTYVLTESQPLAYVDAAETAGSLGGDISVNDVISAVPVTTGQTGTGYNFGERGSGLTGLVYVDTNNNGIPNGGEPGIQGVTITLTGTDNAGNPVSLTTTTAAGGTYSFIGIPASNGAGYTVTETQPPAWADGTDRVGSVGGTLGNDILSAVVLNGVTVGTDYDFGERGGSLAGTVYHDTNNNGLQGTGEPGIQGVTISLTGTDVAANAVNATTTTAIDGTYSFTDLARPNGAGYTITETQPALYNDGIDTAGSLGGNVTVNDITSAILFPVAGAQGTGYNFGEQVINAAQVSGRVWFDANHDRFDNDGAGSGRSGWIVELIKRADPLSTTFTPIATAVTDVLGEYSFAGLIPNNAAVPTDRYEIRFHHPENNVIFGQPVSTHPGVDLTYGTIRDVLLVPGANVTDQDLPLDPGGVIYNSVSRDPVAGAVVSIAGPGGFDPAAHLVGGAAAASQTTGASGQYQFLLVPAAPAGTYTLTVTSPAGYLPAPSALIPTCTNTLNVGAAPDPLLIQTSNTAPVVGIPLHTPGTCPAGSAGVAAGDGTTQYYYSFELTPGTSANVVNNHIPIDPILGGAIVAQKTTPKINVSRGDLVPYTLTFTNTLAATLSNIDLHDRIPPGFKYRKGSAVLDGHSAEPMVSGRDLTWTNLTFAANQRRVITLVLVVGSGVGEGEYKNLAWAENNLAGTAVSNTASAVVRVVPDPTFDCSDLIGKVFDDQNANGYQDQGEPGIPNVRVATARGLLVTTDDQGRFHVTCADVPNEDRGANFIMKLDERTLPSGYRLTTENPHTVRLTRGKMTKLNFGATIHRVVRVELANEAFVDNMAEANQDLTKALDQLIETLKAKPSVVRLAYRRTMEPDALIKSRLKWVRKRLERLWKDQGCCYALVFEEEIFDRKKPDPQPKQGGKP